MKDLLTKLAQVCAFMATGLLISYSFSLSNEITPIVVVVSIICGIVGVTIRNSLTGSSGAKISISGIDGEVSIGNTKIGRCSSVQVSAGGSIHIDGKSIDNVGGSVYQAPIHITVTGNVSNLNATSSLTLNSNTVGKVISNGGDIKIKGNVSGGVQSSGGDISIISTN